MSRENKTMSMDVYKKIVDEAAEWGVHSMSLYALGEPMLDKHIRERIIYAKRMGVPYCDVSSNCSYDLSPLLGTSLN